MPSSMRATSAPPQKSVFIPVASRRDQKLGTGNGAIRTGGNAEPRILKFGGDRAQADRTSRECRCRSSPPGRSQPRPACDRGCTPWRSDRAVRPSSAGARESAGYSCCKRATTCAAGSCLVPHRKQDFECRIVLLEKCPQIRFEIEIKSGQRLEDADRFSRCGAAGLHRQIAPRGDNLQQGIDDRSAENEGRRCQPGWCLDAWRKELATAHIVRLGAWRDRDRLSLYLDVSSGQRCCRVPGPLVLRCEELRAARIFSESCLRV